MSDVPLAPPELDMLRRALWYGDRLREAGVEFDPAASYRELAELYRKHWPRERPQRTITEVLDALRFVTAQEFAATEEEGAEALLGEPDAALIPANGDVMVYGDGGAGKTTLTIDLAFHLAAGEAWLGFPVKRPLNIALIENEGPRPMFRAKLRRKTQSWGGEAIFDERLIVLEEPWAALTLADEAYREALATVIDLNAIDVVVAGPLTRLGMNEAGTLQEVRDFMALIGDLRSRSNRPLALVLVHHENKGGKVSGAWEGAGDTLLHVQGAGHGHTRLYVQKARWASSHHATTLHLNWTDGDGFELADKPELDEETIAEQMVAFIAANPGTGWTPVEKATPGLGKEKRRAIRDGLFATRRILNVVLEDGVQVALYECPQRRKASLYVVDDPVVAHLRPGSGAGLAQSAPASGAGDQLRLRPAPALKEAQGVGAAHAPGEDLVG